MKSSLVAGILLLAAAGAAWYWLAGGDGLPVQTAEVEIGTVREFVDERGKTRLPKTYLVTMPFTGRLTEITLQEGDRVVGHREGEPLASDKIVAQIVPSDLQLSVDAAQSAVNRLEASIKENDDISVESTGLRQTLAFVESMARTVESAEARVEAGQKRMEFAEAQLGRERQSFDAGGSTQEALDRAEVQFVEARVDYQQDRLVLAAMRAMQTATNLTPTMVRQYIDRKQLSRDVLEEQRDEAQVQLERALLDARRGVLTSPVDGVVLTRHVSNERYLAAGEVLLEIGQLDQLQVEVEVLSQDVVNIKPGDPAEVYGPAIGPRPAAATVERVYPAGFTKVSSLGVEQQRVLVVLAFDEAELARLREQRDLGVDYRVRVKIYTETADDTLRVPRSALFRGPSGGEDWQVFAVEAGRARLKPVKVGLMNDDEVQILEGLSPGQQVILAPETDLQDGAAVRAAS